MRMNFLFSKQSNLQIITCKAKTPVSHAAAGMTGDQPPPPAAPPPNGTGK